MRRLIRTRLDRLEQSDTQIRSVGVLRVPPILDVDTWSALASAQQERIVHDAREYVQQVVAPKPVSKWSQ